MASPRVQVLTLVSLLALLPVAVFIVTGQSELLGALAGLNVLIIAYSLYEMFGPAEERPGSPH
jgi:hypothetical protein